MIELETSQVPLFNKHVVFEGGHGQFPQSAMIREVLGWRDKYLGPVEAHG